MESFTGFRTIDGKVFVLESEARKHEAIIEFTKWIEEEGYWYAFNNDIIIIQDFVDYLVEHQRSIEKFYNSFKTEDAVLPKKEINND